MPRVMTTEETLATDMPTKSRNAHLRTVFSNYSHSSWPQQEQTGNISIPTPFICGNQDTSILCTESWALSTEDYCTNGYTYLEVDCGHNLTACDDDPAEQIKTSILAHLVANSPLQV